MKSCHFALILFMLFMSNLLTAQDVSLFRNLSTADGLQNNSVKALYKDSVGFIWIGARTELHRFDGHEIKSFSSTFDDEILAIEELNSETLIIGTATSLFEFDRMNDKVSQIELDVKKSRVKTIKKIDANSYLVGIQSGLYLVKEGKQVEKIILDANIFASNNITSIERENEDIFWI